MSNKAIKFEERIRNFPYLKSKFESILDIIESKGGNVDRADEAEELLIEEMRQLGKEALHDWAIGKEVEKVKEFVNDKDGIKQHSKKNSVGIRPLVK